MFRSIFVLAAMALPGAATHPPSIEVVAPDPASARGVEIVGATPAEIDVTRAALARLGSDGPVLRVVFGHQARGRSITAAFSPGRSDDFQNFWLTELALEDAGTTLNARGGNVTWIELSGPQGGGSAFEPLTVKPLDQKGLRKLSREIAVRARRQHQPVVKIVAYPVAGGALRAVIELSREEYLRGGNTNWLDVLPDRSDADSSYSADVRVLGPGGVRAAEGASFGAAGGAFGYGPSARGTARPIEGPVSLHVAVHRVFPKKQEFSFAIDCAQETATCAGIRRNWTLLVPPVVSGAACLGPAGADTLSVSGSIEGIPVERSYDGCYGGVTARWERLLGVPTRR